MQVTGEPCSGNQVLAEFRPQQVPGSVKVPQTGFPESGSGPEFDVLGKWFAAGSVNQVMNSLLGIPPEFFVYTFFNNKTFIRPRVGAEVNLLLHWSLDHQRLRRIVASWCQPRR